MIRAARASGQRVTADQYPYTTSGTDGNTVLIPRWALQGPDENSPAENLEMHLRDGVVILREGEFFIVPRGVEHKPVAREEVHLLLLEPAGTLNTGNVRDARTLDEPEWI